MKYSVFLLSFALLSELIFCSSTHRVTRKCLLVGQKLPEELHVRLLPQSLTFPIRRFHNGPVRHLRVIYSILPVLDRLFPSRRITVSIKLNQFTMRRGRALHTQMHLSHARTRVRSYARTLHDLTVSHTSTT